MTAQWSTRLGAVVLLAVACLGLGAPLWSQLLGFTPDEQHTWLSLQPPGARDASLDLLDYDVDSAGFAALDRNGDGRLVCTRLSIPSGELRCPELDRWRHAERWLALLLARLDRSGPDAAPPDGALSRAEFLVAVPDLDPTTRLAVIDLGLAGQSGFAQLDRNRDGAVDRTELALAMRPARLDPEALLRDHDHNHDLAMDRGEFPGLPVLHTFWLGTDAKGRCLLVRLCYGARISLGVAVLAALVSALIGVLWGALAGWYGGRVDLLMMRAVDVLYGLPFMLVVILLLLVAGRSLVNLFVALGAVSWLSMARLVRGEVMALRRREFVVASIALGLPTWRTLGQHVLPHALGPIVVLATLQVPAMIMEEAFLSYLGLGVQPPDASWGTLLAEGSRAMTEVPWLLAVPAVAMAATVLALHTVGERIRVWVGKVT